MTKFISFAAAAAFIASGTAPVLAQSAHFEARGFPTTLQAQITGLADLQEQAPTPTLVAGGMPVSPHQLAVLSPRRQDEPVQVVQRHDAGVSVKR